MPAIPIAHRDDQNRWKSHLLGNGHAWRFLQAIKILSDKHIKSPSVCGEFYRQLELLFGNPAKQDTPH